MDNTIIQVIPLLYTLCITLKGKYYSMLGMSLYHYTYIYRKQYLYDKLDKYTFGITRITFCKLNNNNHVAVIHTLYTASNAISNHGQDYQ